MNTTHQSRILCLASSPVINNKQHHQTGFTLTELLVAMLLGVLVLIAASSLFFSSYRTHRTTDAVSRLQEKQRLAFELMARDIRNTGSFPCKGMDNLVFLHGNSASSDWPEVRYYLASSLIGNYYEHVGFMINPDGTKTPLTPGMNKHKDDRFDTIYLLSGNSMEGNAWNHPVIEHHRPGGVIKALNLDTINKITGTLVICNAETAIMFDTNPNAISADTIKITTGMGNDNLCGGGFTRNPDIALMSADCDKPYPLGPGYCFWGDMTVTPTEEDKAACDEIGQSQAYIFNFHDLIRGNMSMWFVDNIDAEHRGDLFNDKYGKVAEGITSLQLRYRLKGSKKYIDAQTLIDTTEPFDYQNRKGGIKFLDNKLIENPRAGWSQVDSVHLKMTFQTPDKVGTDGKALERTMETYIAIRSRMPEMYNEYAH